MKSQCRVLNTNIFKQIQFFLPPEALQNVFSCVFVICVFHKMTAQGAKIWMLNEMRRSWKQTNKFLREKSHRVLIQPKDSFSDLLERCKTVKISFISLPYTMTKRRSLEWNASHECTATARLDFPDFPQIFPPDIFRARVHFCNRKPHVNKMGAALRTFDFSDFSFF